MGVQKHRRKISKGLLSIILTTILAFSLLQGFGAIASADEGGGSPLVPLSVAPTPEVPFSNYTLSPGEIKSWEVPLSNLVLRPKMDIVYVIDTTGSMSGQRSTVANTVNQFTSDLMAAGATDIQFGAAYYGDYIADEKVPWYGLSLPLGDHSYAVIANAITNLRVTDGGDNPEDSLMAYIQTMLSVNWREDAQHVIVLVTDASTHVRPTVNVEGYPVTYASAATIAAAKDIDLVITSYLSYPLSAMASALGVTEYSWSNGTDLINRLRTAVIPPVDSLDDYFCEAKVESITYLSDSAASTDVNMTITPASFILRGGETKKFDLSGTAVTTPTRYGDTTVVEIGFYVDGIRVPSATQFLYFRVEPYYDVTYTITSTANPNPALTRATPAVSSFQEGDEVSVESVLTTTSTTNAAGQKGTWTFVGWQLPAGITAPSGVFDMPGGDVSITGYWTFAVDPYYDVTYTITSTANPSPALTSVTPATASYQAGDAVTVAPVLTTTSTTNAAGQKGVWTFVGWQLPSGITAPSGVFDMPGSNVSITGSWTFSINPYYDVTYTITSTANPSPALTSVTPATASYQAGDAVTVAPVLTTTSTTNAAGQKGVWTFVGWQLPSGITAPSGVFDMPGSNVSITGSWTFAINPYYDVTYTITSTANPAPALTSATPATASYQAGDAVTVAPVLTTTSTTNAAGQKGVWTFVGWQLPAGVTTISGVFVMPGSNVSITGYWTFAINPYYDVTYTITSTANPAPALTSATPATASYQAGDAVTVAPVLTTTSTTNAAGQKGVWTFVGWQLPAGVTAPSGVFDMPGANVSITGSWTFSINPYYDVTYTITSTANPAPALTSATPATSSYQAGDAVTVAPVLTTTSTTNAAGQKGVWTFVGWQLPTGITAPSGVFAMPGSNVSITGSWTFSINPYYDVTYTITSTANPAPALTSVTPATASYQAGDAVTVAPVLTTTSTKNAAGENGVWTFVGWQLPTGITATSGIFSMPGANVSITGSWTFEIDPYYNVTYTITSTANPDPALTSITPAASSFQEGDAVTVALSLTTTSTKNAAGENGVWTFVSWELPVGLTATSRVFNMPGENVSITGYWTFAIDPYYDVTYTITSTENPSPALTSIMPSTLSYQEGTAVSLALALTTTSTKNTAGQKGVWTFVGWELPTGLTATSGIFSMPGENVSITGSWTFEVDPYYEVTYTITSTASPDPALTVATPLTTAYQEGDEVTVEPVLTTTSTTNAAGLKGVWTFVGWELPDDLDITDGVFNMPGEDVSITGAWTFIADPIVLKETRPSTGDLSSVPMIILVITSLLGMALCTARFTRNLKAVR